jgi:predicted ATPase/class 3 adenylate cyclase/DNA-binding CsgD family transcriptional regulator
MTYAIETIAPQAMTAGGGPPASRPMGLPIGTVTFLLTDIEESSIGWGRDADCMGVAVARHYDLLDEAISAFGGVRPEEQGEGDSVVAAFSRASGALGAALRAQLALQAEPWPTAEPIKVRMAVHTGEARLRGESNYMGPAIVRAARLRNLAHGGQVLVSSGSRDLALDQLGDEISLIDLGEHRLKDLARPERVYQLAHERLTRTFTSLRSLDSFAHNLPVRLSTFIGRQDELATLNRLLAEHRLVTITGAGGAGKTRLALQTAADHVDRYPDGTWWIELAPLTDTDQVPMTVASVLQVPLTESGDRTEAIASHLGNDRALIVFDNCEHLDPLPAQVVQTLLERCPNVTVLATSRAPLDVPGELCWRVPPLALPDRETVFSIDRLSQFEAVQLFVDRAGHARPTFTLTDDNGPAVAEICSRLDGIPLAIELAASRTKSMLPAQILQGLDDALRLLSGGSRLVLPRQQTLEASIRWSCQLLDEPAGALLYRLSIFTGTFDLAAAEGVCADAANGTSPAALARMDVLDALERLVDRSLVVSLDGLQSGRFMILETVRQFGNRRLVEAETLDHWRENHARYYTRLADEVAPRCETAEQFAALRTLRTEIDNVRTALHWWRNRIDGERLADVVCSLGPYWDVGGDKLEAVDWCSRALAVLPVERTWRHARLLALRAESRLTLGDWAGSLTDAQDALALGAEVDDLRSQGRGSSVLTTVHAYAATLEVWRARWTETVRLQRAAGDLYGLAGTMQWGAVPLIRRGFTSEGLAALAEAEADVARCGSPELRACQQMWEGFARLQSGESALAERLARSALDSGALGAAARIDGAQLVVALARGQLGVARSSADEHLATAEQAEAAGEHVLSGNRLLMAGIEAVNSAPALARTLMDRLIATQTSLQALSKCEAMGVAIMAALHLGDLDDVVARATVLRELAETCESPLHVGRAHIWTAGAQVLRDETREADRHLHLAIDLLAGCGARFFLVDAIEVLAVLAERSADPNGAARLLGASRRMRQEMESPRSLRMLEQAARAARATLGDEAFEAAFAAGAALTDDEMIAFVERTRGTRGRPSVGWDSLTPTELQVSELVRDGLTNREIGEHLLMGAETVKTHLSHIFTKLGLSKRVQLAALVSERPAQDER